jgi:hypothetical protein
MTDDELDETPTALVVQVTMSPEAAKTVRTILTDGQRAIGVQLGQRPPVHTQRRLDGMADDLAGVVRELDLAIANPIAVPVPELGGDE